MEFSDPAAPDERRFRVNTTFLLSNYECIFGQGCPSIKPQMDTRHDCGCCNQGAGFYDQDDVKNVAKWFKKLTFKDMPEDKLRHARKHGWTVRNSKGEAYKTRKLNGACIFANEKSDDPDAPPSGCAFHVLGNRLGIDHTKIKPEVCWTVPLLVLHDGETTGREERPELITITAQGRGEWGGDYPTDYTDLEQVESGAYLGWWCVAEGTLVATETGQKPIERVSQQDRVLTRAGFRQVLKRWDNGERPTLKIVHEGGTLYVTEDHKLLTNLGWLSAGHIRALTADSVTTVGANVSVGVSEPMSARASVAKSSEGFGSQNVYRSGDDIEVPDVAAPTDTTEVVYLMALGDRAINTLPDKNVRFGSAITDTHVAVAGAVNGTVERKTLVGVDSEVFNPMFSSGGVQGDGVAGLAPDSSLVDGAVTVNTSGVHSYTIYQIEEGPVQRVYDLTVEGQHEYVAGGVVVHNCTDTPDAYSGDKAAYIYFENELRIHMGDAAYEQLAKLLAAYGERRSQMPGERINDGKPTIGTIESLVASLKAKQGS